MTTTTSTDWTTTSLSELIRYIVTEHHAYLRKVLPRIGDSLMSGQAPVELRDAFSSLRSELMSHLDKEEAVLFPAIERFESAVRAGEPVPRPCFGSMQLPIRVMEQEHDLANVELARLRELTKDYSLPAGYCVALRELDENLVIHMQLENGILFPKAMMLDLR